MIPYCQQYIRFVCFQFPLLNIKDGVFYSNSQRLKAVNYHCKVLHLTCLPGSWLRHKSPFLRQFIFPTFYGNRENAEHKLETWYWDQFYSTKKGVSLNFHELKLLRRVIFQISQSEEFYEAYICEFSVYALNFLVRTLVVQTTLELQFIFSVISVCVTKYPKFIQ